jgi:protein ImuB
MFAVIHLEDFALQAVLRLEPGLAEKPAALIAGEARSVALVACNARARAAGVAIGQTVPLALARCAGLALRPVNLPAEAEARAGLLAAAWAVSPSIEATAPGVCTLQLAGLDAEKREPALRAAVEALAQLGLRATAGIGATPLLAQYAARRTEEAVLVVRDGRTFLATLPLAAADPTPVLAEVLQGWGIRTLGELTALPKADVTHRLGPAGLALWERASGETSRPLHLITPSLTFSAHLECEHAMETLEPLLFVLRRFVDRLALDLGNAHQAARALTLRLALENETSYEHTLRLPEPATEAELLFRTLHSHLEAVRTDSCIVGVTLEIDPVRIAVRQQGLFDCALRDPHGFAETLARAAAIVGAERVGTPRLENTHRPDAFTQVAPAPTLPPLAERFRHEVRGLALRRFRPALPANVELDGIRPVYVASAEVRGFVRERAGPWYGSGDWWEDGKAWDREEWDVALEEGGLFRVVRVPGGRWIVEGEYD